MPIYNDDAGLGVQVIGLLAIFSWVFVTSLIAWFAIKKTAGIRVGEAHEYEGVDISECGKGAYPEFATADQLPHECG